MMDKCNLSFLWSHIHKRKEWEGKGYLDHYLLFQLFKVSYLSVDASSNSEQWMLLKTFVLTTKNTFNTEFFLSTIMKFPVFTPFLF